MTPIFFLVFYVVGILLTLFRHPIYGLYTYLFTFYMAPAYTWWRDDIPELRYLLIIGIVAVVASLRLPVDTGRAKWHQTGAGRLFLLFVLFNWLQIIWAIDRDLQIEGAILYTKHLVAFYLVYRFADSIERVIQIAMVHVLGCFWFGLKALEKGGGRLEDIGGAVASANELGIHIVTGVLFGGLMLLGIRDWRRIIMIGCLPFIVNCLILTISRGAFVGLAVGGIVGYIAIPQKLRFNYKVFGVLGLILFSLLIHDQLIERFMVTYHALTSDQVELDGSAVSRSEIASAGFRMGLDYPLGAGHRATLLLSPQYMDEHLLGEKTGQRAAHNTSAAVVAEHGFPGLILYFLIIFWVLRTMVRMRRSGNTDETERHGMCMAFIVSSLIAIYAAGNFSNTIGLEAQYWCLALLASVSELQAAVVGQADDIVQKSKGKSKTIARGAKKLPL